MARLDKTGLAYFWGKITERIAGTVTTHTMLASGWTNGVYSFENDYPSTDYDIETSLNGDSCTQAQLKAWSKAQIAGSPTSNTCKALGIVPSIDIPVFIKAVRK